MIYTNLFLNSNQKKIPNWLIIVFVFIFSVIFFINQLNKTVIDSKADSSKIERFEILNLTPYEATIFWQTKEKEIGWIIFEDEKSISKKIVLDNRDSLEIKNKYKNHFVTIKNLSPDSKYYFDIVSNNKKISFLNKRPIIKTPKFMKSRTRLDPVIGKVLYENFQPLKNGIVILYINDKIIPLSTITKESGEWLIPLNYFLDKNTLEEAILTGDEVVTIEILSEDDKKTSIINKLKNISLKNETYFIGKKYNNFIEENVLSAVTNNKNISDDQYLEIIYPIQNALIPGNQPLIKGKTLPNKQVFIFINSLKKNYSGKTISNKLGEWQYYIGESLEKGKYTLKIEVLINNKLIKKSRIFHITANDAIEGKVLGEATGESKIIQNTPTPTRNTLIPTSTIKLINPTVVTPTSLKRAGILEIMPLVLGLGFSILGFGIIIIF